MTLTAQNVRVATTGAIYTAPTGTSLPSSVADALDGAFVELGYANEDGVTTATATDTNQIRAWQNGDIVRTVQTSHEFTIAFTALETNPAVLEAYYGNFTAGPGGASGVVEITGDQPYRGAWVIDVVDDDQLIRLVIPDGQITERDDVVYAAGDPVQYGLTITCFPDDAGVKAYKYFETDAAS